MLGDVGQPELVWSIGGEVPLDKIVMDRRAGLAVEPPLLRVRREDPLGRAKPPDPTLGGDEPEVSQVVSDRFRRSVEVSQLGALGRSEHDDSDRPHDRARIQHGIDLTHKILLTRAGCAPTNVRHKPRGMALPEVTYLDRGVAAEILG